MGEGKKAGQSGRMVVRDVKCRVTFSESSAASSVQRDVHSALMCGLLCVMSSVFLGNECDF